MNSSALNDLLTNSLYPRIQFQVRLWTSGITQPIKGMVEGVRNSHAPELHKI